MHEIHKSCNIYLYISMENKEKKIKKLCKTMISTQLCVNKILSQKKPERINYADVGYCRLDVVTGL